MVKDGRNQLLAYKIISLFCSEAGLYWDDLGEDQKEEVRSRLIAMLEDA